MDSSTAWPLPLKPSCIWSIAVQEPERVAELEVSARVYNQQKKEEKKI
jgi:hypothetical protein